MKKSSFARRIWHHFSAYRRFGVEIKNYEKHIKELKRTTDKNKQKCIVFIINFPESWNSVKSIYEEACNRAELEVHIVAVPRSVEHCEPFHSITELRNDAYDFFVQLGIDAIKANENNEWFDLAKLHPDYVIYTRPYLPDYPDIYKSVNVCTFAKICYIPYAYSMLANGLKVLPEPFVLTTHRMYLATESRKEECCNWYPSYIKEDKKRFQYFGFPRFDLYGGEEKRISGDKVTIAWLPRWTTGDVSNNKGSHFLEYYMDFLEYAKTNTNIKVIIRPHPNMFPNYIENGIMTKEAVDSFMQHCKGCGNVIIDQTQDYIDTIRKSDILVADYTSLIAEFFMTGKPIIYCDTADGLNSEGSTICGNLYRADTFSEIIDLVEKIKNGRDDQHEHRKKIIKELLPAECGNIGKTILDSILES